MELNAQELCELKKHVRESLRTLASGGDPGDCYHTDALWWGCHPFNEIQGLDAISNVWNSIRSSLPDLERRDSIFVAGTSAGDDRTPMGIEGRVLIASICHYQGTFVLPLLGIPATNGVVHLRSCEVHHVEGGRISQSYVLMDLLDLMWQAGVWPLAPSLGAEGMWPGPATADGVDTSRCCPETGAAGLSKVLKMHAGLGEFDGTNISSMPIEEYWTENFQYYAASGIGMTRGLSGFRLHHQIPFLTGFPDRKGAGHYVRIGDGDYVVTGGWPSVEATHLGEWLGLPATGTRVKMRVMDFYRFENDRIAENWVPIDIIDVLRQMGFDVFSRLKHSCGQSVQNVP